VNVRSARSAQRVARRTDRTTSEVAQSSWSLALPQTRLDARIAWAWAIVVYAAGVFARYGIHARSDGKLLRGPDGHRALTSIDAYYYASGLKRVLTGALADYDRLPTWSDSGLVTLSAGVARALGLHSSDVAYFFPIVAGPLVVVSVFAWARVLALPSLALLGALPAALGFSYLNRTGPGQFDTDPFAVVIPYLALAASAGALVSRRAAHASAAGLLFAVSSYFHPGAERVLLGCSLVVGAYVVVAHRHRVGAQLLLVLAVSLAPLPIPARLALLLCIALLARQLAISDRSWLIVGACCLAASACASYMHSDLTILLGGARRDDGLRFYDVRGEVAELRALSTLDMTKRVSGGPLWFALSTLGLLGLTWTRRCVLLLWPLFLLGTIGAELRGLRFTIYAVPAAALGLAWLAAHAIELVRTSMPPRIANLSTKLATVAAVLLLAAPAISHASRQKLPSTYTTAELALMGELARHAKPGDYVLAWWDQAYGLWYYAGVRTLVDGMKQDEDLFVVAESLFGSDQRLAANLARQAVERGEQSDHPRPVVRKLFAEAASRGLDADAYLSSLSVAHGTRNRARDIYLFMPARVSMMASGWSRARKIGGVRTRGDASLGIIDVGKTDASRQRAIMFSGRALDLVRWQLVGPGAQRIPIASTHQVNRGATGWQETPRHVGAPLHALLVPDGSVLVVDAKMLHSNYVQLAAFEKNIADAYAPVGSMTGGALYRVVP
jgi:hypothetical protein